MTKLLTLEDEVEALRDDLRKAREAMSYFMEQYIDAHRTLRWYEEREATRDAERE